MLSFEKFDCRDLLSCCSSAQEINSCTKRLQWRLHWNQIHFFYKNNEAQKVQKSVTNWEKSQHQNLWQKVKFKRIELHFLFHLEHIKNKIKKSDCQISENLRPPKLGRNLLVHIKRSEYVFCFTVIRYFLWEMLKVFGLELGGK